MASDRSGYRNFYPGLLRYTEQEWAREISRVTDPVYVRALQQLHEDTLKVRQGIDLVRWPWPNTLELTQKQTQVICESKIKQGKALTSENIRVLEKMKINRDRIYKEIPQHRLTDSRNWIHPFDAIDLELDLNESDFPVPDDVLEITHNFVDRGHNWFGVGEWNIASWCYFNALTIALSTNNLPAAEMSVRFMVDTYTAAKDCQSAANITNDFLHSRFIHVAEITFFTNLRDIFASTIMAFALDDRWSDVDSWVPRMSSETGDGPQRDISKWSIHELLVDVYQFRRDTNAVNHLANTTTRLAQQIIYPF